MCFGNHSQKNLKDFYCDFIYAISREYYIYTESHEYITYGLLTNELKINILEEECADSFNSIKDLALVNNSYYRTLYGDDYVDNSESIDLLLSDDEELLMLDLEESSFLDVLDVKELVEDLDDEEENSELYQIDDTLFDDPIKMVLSYLSYQN
jgi:hypothetical protein